MYIAVIPKALFAFEGSRGSVPYWLIKDENLKSKLNARCHAFILSHPAHLATLSREMLSSLYPDGYDCSVDELWKRLEAQALTIHEFTTVEDYDPIMFNGETQAAPFNVTYIGVSEVNGPQAQAIIKTFKNYSPGITFDTKELRMILEESVRSGPLVTREDVIAVFKRNLTTLSSSFRVAGDKE